MSKMVEITACSDCRFCSKLTGACLEPHYPHKGKRMPDRDMIDEDCQLPDFATMSVRQMCEINKYPILVDKIIKP